MIKEFWVIYEIETLTDTGGRTDYKREKIGEYDNTKEAQYVYKAILEGKPDEVDIEIVIEKESREVADETPEVLRMEKLANTVEKQIFLLEQQMAQLADLINNQATIINNFDRRIKKMERVIN